MARRKRNKAYENIGTEVDKAKKVWRNADAVMFDIDCTLVTQSPIIELARFCNKETSILKIGLEALTTKRPFKDTLKDCVEFLLPSKHILNKFNNTCRLRFSPNLKSLISLLQNKHIPIYLVSGGFRSLITPLAQALDIPKENIFSNRLEFYFDGSFAGFSENSALAQLDGKRTIAIFLKETHGYNNLVNIGDGSTDLNAQGATDAFIGYGGNIVRDDIKNAAMWFIVDFKQLIDELNAQDSSDLKSEESLENIEEELCSTILNEGNLTGIESLEKLEELSNEICENAITQAIEITELEAKMIIAYILNNL